MEKESIDYENLVDLMKKIDKAIIMSKVKQEELNNMQDELNEELRPMMVEKRKQEIESKELAKKEFDNMTAESLKIANFEIKLLKEKIEKEYNQKIVDSMSKEKRIQQKLEALKARNLDDDKLIKANNFANEALEKNKKDMEDFQIKHFEQSSELDKFEKTINDYALEIGINLYVENSKKAEVEVESEPEVKLEPEAEPEVKSESEIEQKPSEITVEQQPNQQKTQEKKSIPIKKISTNNIVNKPSLLTDKEIKKTIGNLVSDVDMDNNIKPKSNNKKGININLKDRVATFADEFENRKISIPINKNNINHLYYSTNLNNIIKNYTKSNNIFKNHNLKRKIDPIVVSLLSNNEGKLIKYVESLYFNEKDSQLPIIYNLKDADEKDLISVSKYAKHAKAIAEINGELAKNSVERMIDGIKNIPNKLFNKIKTLKPAKKVLALNESEIYDTKKLENAEEEAKKMNPNQQFRNSHIVNSFEVTPKVKKSKISQQNIER